MPDPSPRDPIREVLEWADRASRNTPVWGRPIDTRPAEPRPIPKGFHVSTGLDGSLYGCTCPIGTDHPVRILTPEEAAEKQAGEDRAALVQRMAAYPCADWCCSKGCPGPGNSLCDTPPCDGAQCTCGARDIRTVGQEAERLHGLLALAVPVLGYVSRGRRYVDVEKYPDATARTVLGAIADHDPRLLQETPDA